MKIKKSSFGFIRLPLLTFIVSVILLTSTGVGVFLYNNTKPKSTIKKINVARLTQTPIPSPTLTPKQEVLGESKSENTVVKSSPTSTVGLSPLPKYNEQTLQMVKSNPSINIELCRSKAKEKRNEEEKKINEEYALSETAKVELAATQNNSETETIALKHGIISQSQIVRRADVFEKYLSEGYPLEQAESAANVAGEDYSNYLRSLHDWAAGELNKWNEVVKTRFDLYESQVYQNCLNSL